MSYSNWKPTYLTNEGKEKQLLNSIFTNHDLCCGCDDPAAHIVALLCKNCEPKKFNEEEKTSIKKCLGGEETTTAAEEILDFGDLETLFGENFEDGTG